MKTAALTAIAGLIAGVMILGILVFGLLPYLVHIKHPVVNSYHPPVGWTIKQNPNEPIEVYDENGKLRYSQGANGMLAVHDADGKVIYSKSGAALVKDGDGKVNYKNESILECMYTFNGTYCIFKDLRTSNGTPLPGLWKEIPGGQWRKVD